MAYSINPNLPKARAIALKLLIVECLPVLVVANHCGVHRSTIWRWYKKWQHLNRHVQLTNYNRPNRESGAVFRQSALRWHIPTISSRPHSCLHAISENVVKLVLEVRQKLKRCAEVVWHYVTTKLGVAISLSSVKRILRRHHCFDGARKPRLRPDNPKRPLPTRPGELVEIDTIHYVCPYTNRRSYVYTIIDLYTRLAYAEVHHRILPGLAAKAVLNAQKLWQASYSLEHNIAMVQSDNGLEFSNYFKQKLKEHNIQTRHTRLGRPNDNAHIERFNRTIQEECLGHSINSRVTNVTLQAKLNHYLDYYNNHRIHLGLQLQTPAQMLQRF